MSFQSSHQLAARCSLGVQLCSDAGHALHEFEAGQPAATVMSLVHASKINGYDLYAYLKDVLERLPTQPTSRI